MIGKTMISKIKGTHSQDVPVMLWAFFPPTMLVFLIFMAFVDPQFFLLMLAKDRNGGIVEHATVLILLPGVIAGFVSFFYHRERLPSPWLGWWILMWTLACVYFAGEEISWGQWLFHWKTPEIMKGLNFQNETNLHNISTWLNYKPQAIVEGWIISAGGILPVWMMIKKNKDFSNREGWKFWIFPTYVCIPAAVLTILTGSLEPITKSDLMPHFSRIGSSELREYYIALFLCIYLLSFWVRVRNTKV